jgi:hypothetical protein
MNTFQTGTTYYARSVCDFDCVITVQVIKRTAKTITAIVDGQKTKTLRIRNHGGVDVVMPWGSYSMAPVVRADRVLN